MLRRRRTAARFVAQRLDRPQRVAAGELQRWTECIGFGEPDECGGRNAGTAPEIVDRAERLLGASGDDGGSIGVGETFDHTDVEQYREAILPVRWPQGAVPSGGVDADRSHVDAVIPCIADENPIGGIEKRRAEHVGMPALPAATREVA